LEINLFFKSSSKSQATIMAQPTDSEMFRNATGFRSYEPVFVKKMLEQMGVSNVEALLCPLLDFKNNKRIEPTYQKNVKFSLSEKAVNSSDMYKTAIITLIEMYEVPRELLSGRAFVEKEGRLLFNNEYETCLRIWTTKKVGKNIMYEVSVSGYKDAIPVDM